MSKFITSIPVDFGALLKGVPKNTHIESVSLTEDRQTVEVIWDNPALESPVAGAWPFPFENLAVSGELPEGVKLADWVTKPKAETHKTAEEDADKVGVGKKAVVHHPGKHKK